MKKEITEIKVFVSCPDDVKDEKAIVREVCDSITKVYGKKRNIQITVVDWKKNVIPVITGDRTQSLIYEQIGEYDIYLGILWKRFGDKQENGLTPTEEEFEDALKQKKETGKPIITFFFKCDKYYPNDPYEAQQACEVQKFKKRIENRDIGRHEKFKGKADFTNKIWKSILYYVDNFGSLTAKKLSIQKIRYDKVLSYLPRRACSVREYFKPDRYFLKEECSEDTSDLVKKNNKIVLLGDAGSGKTTELQRIAHFFSQDNSPFYPIMVSLNVYVTQNISELLPSNWKEIPQNQLLILLDGLDEIESKNRNDAIRQIELFSEKHLDLHIVVSCRTNFYKKETERLSGTLKGFSSYVLLNLDEREKEKYIETKLGPQKEDFKESISRNRLQNLLKMPFYLVELVRLFEENKSLPKTKAKIFEKLLNARIQLDEEHFRNIIELREKQNTIIETLERLALGMEVLGRNYITNNEFQKLISEDSLRELIKYCTVLKKNEGKQVTWQFEHKNFQEYLAAKVLSRQPLDTIKEFISFAPNYRKIIPSWVNTLSFLLSIMDEDSTLFNELIDWIKEIESELITKCEPERIDVSTRFRIFKSIFDHYKEKKVWINFDKFDYNELAQFGQSEETLDFLLTELENPAHYTTLYNTINLLSYLTIPPKYEKRTTKLLVNYALDSEKGESIQNNALVTLADLRLNSQEIINQIVPMLSSSNNSQVRSGLYYLLYNSDYLDENIDVFLDGIKYVRFHSSIKNGKMRLADERWHLKKGLEKARSPEAIKDILIYFKENPQDLDELSLDESILVIAENAADACAKDSSLLDIVTELFVFLVKEHLYDEEAKKFASFFDKTNERLEVFQNIFSQLKSDRNNTLLLLASLADENTIEYFVQQYENHNIANEDVKIFQNYLSWKNNDLFLPFNKLINEKSGNKFTLPPKKDFDEERKKRIQEDIKLLFDKKKFLEEIKLIFETEKKETFTRRELIEIRTENWEDPYFSELAIHTLDDIAGEKGTSSEGAIQIINKWNWDMFSISTIYNYTVTDEVVLSQEQKDWIAKWCYTHIEKVNFKTAFTVTDDGQFNINTWGIYLWYFLRKLNLDYPENILLDMLSFDAVEGHDLLGIEYLEERLKESNMTTRILKNLWEGIKNDYILKNHIDYCNRHNIKEGLQFALQEIPNKKRLPKIRELALETVCKLSEKDSDLEQILPQVTDYLKWNVVEQLVTRNSKYCHKFLQKILADDTEEEKFKAAEYLIELQDLEGLKYYVEWIKEHNEFPETPFRKSPLLSLETPKSIPFLIELLKISYQDGFVQDDFYRLDRIILDALTVIALESDENYIEIKETIENFINENSSDIENVKFLYIFLESLEKKYYIAKSERLDIDDVIKKLEKIYTL